MTIKTKSMQVATLFALALSTTLAAKVTVQEAQQLGTTLTPLGAEKAGNKAGTIPTWDGGLTQKAGIENADHGRPVNPFKEDKALFIISAGNLSEHKAQLSPGQLAMFAQYPDYKMHVYKTRRTAAYPEYIYDSVKKNASTAELAENGNGIKDFEITIPFPIPKNALEVIWNHISRYRGGSAKRYLTTIPVHKDGSFVPVKMIDQVVWPEFFKGGRDAKKDNNILFYYLQQITAPSRLTGTALLLHETIDQQKEARRAWVYNAGQRRVRRAPNVAYDGPGAGTEGLRTTDNYDMYNGAPDRYNWTLKGKQEVYIPYNSYNLLNPELSYKEIIKAGFLNPEHTRYELHRTWVVEAQLKDDQRHIYAKRTFYIDEDTWGASVIDHYDGRGELWKVSEAHNIQFYDVDTPWMVAETLYDLNSKRYLVTGLSNEEPHFILWDKTLKRSGFSSSALRRIGR